MRKTILSPDRKYRYSLWREWAGGNGAYVVFIGLNPSTADETVDDPTIRRCVSFAKAWGYSALCMLNLFAYRATKPDDMKQQVDPVGPLNDHWLSMLTSKAGLVVAAWGAQGGFMDRDTKIKTLIKDMMCLGITANGFPRHPLYIKGTTQPIPYKVLDSNNVTEYNNRTVTEETAMEQQAITLEGTHSHDNKFVDDSADSTSPIPVDKLVKIFVKIRDAQSAAKKEFEAKDAEFKKQLGMISTELKARAQDEGVDGFKTEFGTVYLSESLKVSGSDWGAFGEFLKTHDPLEFMEKRISSTAIKEYMKANGGELPPGVSIFKELEARVRRASEK